MLIAHLQPDDLFPLAYLEQTLDVDVADLRVLCDQLDIPITVNGHVTNTALMELHSVLDSHRCERSVWWQFLTPEQLADEVLLDELAEDGIRVARPQR